MRLLRQNNCRRAPCHCAAGTAARPVYACAQPCSAQLAWRSYTLYVGDLHISAKLHARHMELLDAFLGMEFDGVSMTLSMMYTTFGMFAGESDLRWQVVDTVRPPSRRRFSRREGPSGVRQPVCDLAVPRAVTVRPTIAMVVCARPM